MPYIGARPVIEFTTIPSKDSFTGDGSTTTFDLATEIATGGENALEVFVNNVRQVIIQKELLLQLLLLAVLLYM